MFMSIGTNKKRWLIFLKKSGNPQYADIKIPESKKEMECTKESLDKMLQEILDQIEIDEFAETMKLELKTRSDVTNAQPGLIDAPDSENTHVSSNVLLCDMPSAIDSDEKLLKSLHKKLTT